MICEINRTSINNGIKNAVKQKLETTELFTEAEGIYTPLSGTNYQEVVDQINNEFKDGLIMKFNNEELYTIVEPSEKLINQYKIQLEDSDVTRTRPFIQWFGNGVVDEKGVPLIDEEGFYTNEKGEKKSILNRGSFLSTDNPTELDLQYPQYENFMINVTHAGKKVGEMWVENDGEHLTLFSAQITGQGDNANVGTNAHLKLADVAKQMGLTFRSDTLPNRMTEASIRTWERFVAAGQAKKAGDRYYFIGEAENVSDNILFSAGEPLKKKQDKEFTRLQDAGLISSYANIVGGKTYYKIPDVDGNKNEEASRVLQNILDSRGLNYIHIVETPDSYLIELAEKDSTMPEVPSFEEVDATPRVAKEVTKRRVLSFLEKIGFRNIQVVNELEYKGQKLQGTAYVDFINGVMQIVEGNEHALPEEAMHILVELIAESRPPLFNQMMKDIVNYQIYRDVLRDEAYTNNKLYQNEDGTLNYDKIKREAVGKLLVEYLIGDLEETPRRTETVYSWWHQIVNWIRETFAGYKNPFKAALEELNDDDTTFGEFADISSDDIFLSAKSVQQIDDETPANKSLWQNIREKAKNQGVTKIGKDYYKNGVLQDKADRVSNLSKQYYDKLFKNKNLDPSEEPFYEQSRKDGDYLHQIFEEVINSWIDPVTGLMKRNPSPITFPLQDNPLQGKIVSDAQKYIKSFLASYPIGTRFITEQIIYDSKVDRYGTIDFQAVLPNGTVDIIDWKSMLMQDAEGAKDYKKEGIFLQINEYKRILNEEYGVERFGKIRAIPIRKNYRKKTNGDRVLMSIDFGNVNAAKIKKDDRSLRPIISPEESTGSELRDDIVTKLGNLYLKYVEKGYFQNDRNILSDVQEAIYEIRVTDSVENLANYFTDLRVKFDHLFKETSKLKNSSKEDISEGLAMITFYEDIFKNVVEPAGLLNEDATIDRESRGKLYNSINALRMLNSKLHGVRKDLLNSQAEKAGIFGLLLPEKVVNLARRYFRSMGSQDIATVRYMYELVKKAYNRIDIATDDRLKELKNLKFQFDEWKKGKGIDNKTALGMIVDFTKGRLHSKINKSFYEKRREVLDTKKGTVILDFIRANYDLTEYKDWYAKTLAENKKIWDAANYDPNDKAKNNRIKKGRLEQFEKTYDIFKHPVTAYGYHNKTIWTRNLKEDKWYSPEYKELIKPGNEPLLELYNFAVERNKELADTGAIKDYEAYTFMPNVRKDMATVLMEEDKNLMQKAGNLVANKYSDWRNTLVVDDYELNYQGQKDSFTGEKLNKRFVRYVSEIKPEDQSFDLFTIYGLMTKEIYKEKYLSENDEIIRSLLHIEKLKPTLEQNKFGIGPEGKPKVSQELGRNAEILEEHVRSIVNGESIQADADFVISMRMRENWNKSPLGKLYKFDVNPETYNPTAISATKFLMWVNTANQKRILGVNAASAISNLFGGSFASSKLYQKYLTREDLNKSWTKLTSGAFYQTEDMKKNAALVDYFLPLLNNRESFKSSQLSVSDAAQVLSQEWLMAPMRKTSEIVQLNIFLAMIENTGIIDGKLVNIREHLREELDYDNRYKLSSADRLALEKKFEEKVKDYKERFSLTKLAQFKTIQEAGKPKVILDIPGFDRNSESVSNIREIVQTMAKDSLGEADEFDVANYKYSIWWRLFMTFKNWIPRQADVRFGEFRYDQAHHSYEYGRFRMFARSISANFVQTAIKLVPIPYLTGAVSNTIFTKDALIRKAQDTYIEKVAQAKAAGKYNPKTFITEGEFIDKFIQGADSTFAEIRTLIFMSAILFMGLAAPDDDDDSSDKAYKALVRKQVSKLIDEVGFFYSPKSGIDIAGGGAPVFSIIRDAWNLGSDVNSQFFGFAMEEAGFDEKGEKMQDQAKPIKRTFKMFPVLKEILTYLPAVDDETAKEWGVKVQDRRAF